MKITLETEMSGVEIFYTLDGSEPGSQSAIYTDLHVNGTVSVKAIAFKNGRPLKNRLLHHHIPPGDRQ